MRDYFSALSAAGYLVCAMALVIAAVMLRRSRAQAAIAPECRFRIVLWAWLLPYAVFLACWDPGSTFHKLFVWPAIVLLIAAYLPQTRARAFVAAAVALAAWNFAAFIYAHAHAGADPVLVLAQRIDRELPRNATIYYRAFSPDDWYLDYFAPGRNWTKLPDANELAPSAALICFETTALDAFRPATLDGPKWDLVNSQHNIRLECRKPQLTVLRPLR